MANMQQLMAQAQKMKREMQKAQDALKEKEFSVTKKWRRHGRNAGSKEVVEVSINEDLFDKDNKEKWLKLFLLWQLMNASLKLKLKKPRLTKQSPAVLLDYFNYG